MLVICPIAGIGSRLFPLTLDKPKAMLKIAGKRIIDLLMDKLSKTFPKGTRFCFIVGYCKDQLIQHLEDHYQSEYNFVFVEQKPLGFKNSYPFYSGLGDAIALAAEYGRNEDCFIFLSDRYPMEEYTPMIQIAEKNQLDGCINTQKVDDPQHYGVITQDSDGLVSKIVEKPKEFISNIAVSGAYYFRKTITSLMFDMLEEQSNQHISKFKEHDFTSIIQQLVLKGSKIGYNLMSRPVLDFGRPNNLLQANRVLIDEFQKGESKIVIGKGSELHNSTIEEYSSIGNNVILDECEIKDSIIGDNCKLEGISLKNAILDDDSNTNNYQNRIIQL